MKFLKTFFAVVLSACLFASSVGCGGNNKKETSPESLTESQDLSSNTQSQTSETQVSDTEVSSYTETSSDTISESTTSSDTISAESHTTTSDSSSCTHSFAQTLLTEPTKTSMGERVFKCDRCDDTFTQYIPKLSTENYSVTTIDATCAHGAMEIYTSATYGTYSIETGAKLSHTTYGGVCHMCKQNVNNLSFDVDNIQTVYDGTSSYPRLYILKDGTWICGFDTWGSSQFPNGTVVLVRSTDQGKTWTTSPVRVSDTRFANYACANTALYQFANGDILCGYRVIGNTGNSSEKYVRALHCSISHDNGYTWEYHSCITNAYTLNQENSNLSGITTSTVDTAITNEGRLGFFEPYFDLINGKLTVMYADDITTWLENPRGSGVLNYETQYITTKEWSGSAWTNRKIILDGTVKKTVGGINEFSRDGMPVFAQMHNGWYVAVVEGTYRRGEANGNHPFEILMTYSKDGVNWSTPVEVYVPHGNGSKASAPYVCVTADDRIIVSFQTDEESIYKGTGIGDGVSIMKTVISDGTPLDKITGTENFYPAQNVFDTPPGLVSAWNGMLLVDDTIYCVSGTNWPRGMVVMQSCKVPESTVGNYCATETAVPSTELTVKNGSAFKKAYGWYRSTTANALSTVTGGSLYNGTISIDVVPKVANDCGLILRASATTSSFWEANASYYAVLINVEGWILLGKITNGAWSCPMNSDMLIKGYSPVGDTNLFSPEKTYNLTVKLNGNRITVYVNGVKAFSYVDNAELKGTMYGIRSARANVWFGNLKVDN